ncbi:MAG: bifunctional 4-hydroxy-2-oxoglutarate aldolase/2-dehydro-3-deoxy-phosphogluconate aldolase [Sphingomicrobium sp.]
MTIDDIMRRSPVIPVLVLDGDGDWEGLARTLVDNGLKVIEVTLRTPGALDVISQMAQVPGAIVGAGTVLNAAQLQAAITAGAGFIVSPGLTDDLAHAAKEAGIPFLPGVATASDIMRGLDHGLDRFKFFPAESSGGLPALKALSGPFNQVRFCPTGGITQDSASDWLALPSVLCVGGSWLVSPGEFDLSDIAARAGIAAKLCAQVVKTS